MTMESIFEIKKRLTYIELVFIVLMMVIFISPELNRIVSISTLLFFELLYSIIISLSDFRIRQLVIVNSVCTLVIALLYSFTTEIVYIEQGASNRIIKSILTITCQYYSLTFPIYMFYRVVLFSNKTQQWFLFIISLLLIFAVVESTLSMLAINEKISKSGMGISNDLNEKAIGGYSFVCSISILSTSLYYVFVKSKILLFKLAAIFLTMFSLFFIVKAQYSIALIASVLGIISSIFLFLKREFRFISVFLLILLYFSLPIILDYIINIVEGDVQLRMIEVKNFIETGDLGDDDMAARMGLYSKGFVSFFDSPFWGNYKLDFNAHSTFIEILASLGVIGALPLFRCIKETFNMLSSFVDARLVTMLAVAFIFMGLTNPIHASLPLNMILWFVCPLLFICIFNLQEEFSYDYSTS